MIFNSYIDFFSGKSISSINHSFAVDFSKDISIDNFCTNNHRDENYFFTEIYNRKCLLVFPLKQSLTLSSGYLYICRNGKSIYFSCILKSDKIELEFKRGNIRLGFFFYYWMNPEVFINITTFEKNCATWIPWIKENKHLKLSTSTRMVKYHSVSLIIDYDILRWILVIKIFKK